jgi:hypothetical protein
VEGGNLMTSFSELFGGGGGFDFEIIEKQTFTTSGTWTKPVTALDTDMVVAYVITGGAGGNNSSEDSGGAGGGGQVFEILSSSLSATETVVVSAGSAAATNSSTLPTGPSSFGVYEVEGCPGGGGGAGVGAGKWAGGIGVYNMIAAYVEINSTYGGGGGADRGSKPGRSAYAGDGGDGVVGVIPGGGGGASTTGSAGARGQVTVYVVRGAYPSIDAIIIL